MISIKSLKILLVSFILISHLACNNAPNRNKNTDRQATEKGNEGIVLEVFPKEKPAILLSSFVDSIAFIPLENNGSGLVADMVKIQVYEGNLYIG
jgi:hypothetical protein